MTAEVTKLVPISIDPGKIFYTPISLELQLKLNDFNEVEVIKGAEPPSESIKSAETFIKMLIANHKLADAGEMTHNATHSVRFNEKGQKIIKRNRF